MRFVLIVFFIIIYFTAEAQHIVGNVFNQRGFPITDATIKIKNIGSGKTSKKGSFIIKSSKSVKNINKSDISVYTLFNPKTDFEIRLEDDDEISIIIKRPPNPVKRISILDFKGKPIKNLEILIDNEIFVSDKNGKINVKGKDVTDESKFVVEKMHIRQIDYLFKKKSIRILIETEEKESKKVVKIPQDNLSEIDEIILRKAILEQKRKDIKREISSLKATLNSDLSNAQRENIKAQIKLFEQELQEIIKEQKALEDLAIENINKLKDIVLEKEEEVREEKSARKEAEINETLAQKQREKEKLAYQKNIIIFTIVIVALLIIALIFFIIGARIRKQRNEIKEKNQLLEQQKSEIEIKNNLLEQKQIEVLQKSAKLKSALKTVSEKNRQVTHSILYAQKIQESVLPQKSTLDKALYNEYFICYQPKDIVSGDFYWIGRKDNELIIAVMDCTGHGVPGAFMTMLGSSALKQIIKENKVSNPAEILKALSINMQKNLKQEKEGKEGKLLDGISGALVKIDINERVLNFAGAKNNLFYVKNDKVYCLKGDRATLGHPHSNKFNNQILEIEGVETFYLASDGFADQLGDEEKYRNRRYLTERFMKLLLDVSQEQNMSLQEQKLQQELDEWKGNNIQTDDITVIGFKLDRVLN